LVGYKNCGKTTLIERLCAGLKARGIGVGYLKHDAHGFQMDREGKDTDRLARAGAERIFIQDGHRQAILKPVPGDPRLTLDFLEADLLLIEGHKGLALPRIAILDPAGAILQDPALQAYPPIAVVTPGPRPELPWSVPTFHRDDVEGLLAFILARFAAKIEQRPLLGLVLTGGQSRRMGVDKAGLGYANETNVERSFKLLGSRCEQVFLSCRAEQAGHPARLGRPQIHDFLLEHGPLGGIVSAFKLRPDAAWLVVACDLPYLDGDVLDLLLAGRNPYRFATAFQGHGGLPEPLCALYEPKCRVRFWQFLAMGQCCPRQVLANSPIALLGNPGKALVNVNTPGDRQEALLDLCI
jgi:molybdopterin-guanine dinucleotide biosynthesis protein A